MLYTQILNQTLTKILSSFGFAMAQSAASNLDVYQQRNPKASAYYKCVENHFKQLEQAWDDMYAPRLGFWRTALVRDPYSGWCGRAPQ